MFVAPIRNYRYVKIEETFLLKGTEEDFVHHLYITKYNKIQGIRTPSEWDLKLLIGLYVKESLQKNVTDLKLLNDEGRNALAWSINWFMCRDRDNKTWSINDRLKEEIHNEFNIYSKDIPLHTRMYIVQEHKRDAVLVAISMEER